MGPPEVLGGTQHTRRAAAGSPAASAADEQADPEVTPREGMGTGAAPRQATLLVHDGELADVRALLSELALPFAERRGALAPATSSSAGAS